MNHLASSIPTHLHICPGCQDITSGPEFCLDCRLLHAWIAERHQSLRVPLVALLPPPPPQHGVPSDRSTSPGCSPPRTLWWPFAVLLAIALGALLVWGCAAIGIADVVHRLRGAWG